MWIMADRPIHSPVDSGPLSVGTTDGACRAGTFRSVRRHAGEEDGAWRPGVILLPAVRAAVLVVRVVAPEPLQACAFEFDIAAAMRTAHALDHVRIFGRRGARRLTGFDGTIVGRLITCAARIAGGRYRQSCHDRWYAQSVSSDLTPLATNSILGMRADRHQCQPDHLRPTNPDGA